MYLIGRCHVKTMYTVIATGNTLVSDDTGQLTLYNVLPQPQQMEALLSKTLEG